LSDGIVEKRLLAKGICPLQFGHQLAALPHRCSSFLYDVKRRPWISFVDDDLAFHELLLDQSTGNGVFVVVWQTAEKPDIFHEFLVFFILLNDDFFDCFPESVPVDGPETAVFTGLDWEGSGGFVKKGDFAKAVSDSQSFLNFFVADDLHHAFFDDEEAECFASLIENEGIAGDTAVEHFFGNILDFGFWEVVEDEMIFEASEEEGHFLVLFLFFLLSELFFVVDGFGVLLDFAVLELKEWYVVFGDGVVVLAVAAHWIVWGWNGGV
jgi:hypothetical protein